MKPLTLYKLAIKQWKAARKAGRPELGDLFMAAFARLLDAPRA
jgi:hypothetical protein